MALARQALAGCERTEHEARGMSGSANKSSAGIARVRIKLADVEPRVVRVLEVPHALRLDRLHLAI